MKKQDKKQDKKQSNIKTDKNITILEEVIIVPPRSKTLQSISQPLSPLLPVPIENSNNKHDQDEHRITSNTDDNVIDQVDENDEPTCSKVNGKEHKKERLTKRPKVRGKKKIKKPIKHITEEIIDGKITYFCTICDRKFTGKTKRVRHKYCDTSIAKPYECDVCKRTFVFKSHYHWHLDSHKKGKIKKCTQCSKTFLRESSLKGHMKVHNETRHPCTDCGRTFLYKRELQLHANKHKSFQPFKCDRCDKKFYYKQNLRQHLFTHSGDNYVHCEYCKRKFTRQSALVKHMRTHSRERKIIECDICSKRYCNETAYLRHSRMHDGNKYYQCTLCDTKSLRRDNIRRHVRNLHPDENYQTMLNEIFNNFTKSDDKKAKKKIQKSNVKKCKENIPKKLKKTKHDSAILDKQLQNSVDDTNLNQQQESRSKTKKTDVQRGTVKCKENRLYNLKKMKYGLSTIINDANSNQQDLETETGIEEVQRCSVIKYIGKTSEVQQTEKETQKSINLEQNTKSTQQNNNVNILEAYLNESGTEEQDKTDVNKFREPLSLNIDNDNNKSPNNYIYLQLLSPYVKGTDDTSEHCCNTKSIKKGTWQTNAINYISETQQSNDHSSTLTDSNILQGHYDLSETPASEVLCETSSLIDVTPGTQVIENSSSNSYSNSTKTAESNLVSAENSSEINVPNESRMTYHLLSNSNNVANSRSYEQFNETNHINQPIYSYGNHSQNLIRDSDSYNNGMINASQKLNLASAINEELISSINNTNTSTNIHNFNYESNSKNNLSLGKTCTCNHLYENNNIGIRSNNHLPHKRIVVPSIAPNSEHIINNVQQCCNNASPLSYCPQSNIYNNFTYDNIESSRTGTVSPISEIIESPLRMSIKAIEHNDLIESISNRILERIVNAITAATTMNNIKYESRIIEDNFASQTNDDSSIISISDDESSSSLRTVPSDIQVNSMSTSPFGNVKNKNIAKTNTKVAQANEVIQSFVNNVGNILRTTSQKISNCKQKQCEHLTNTVTSSVLNKTRKRNMTPSFTSHNTLNYPKTTSINFDMDNNKFHNIYDDSADNVSNGLVRNINLSTDTLTELNINETPTSINIIDLTNSEQNTKLIYNMDGTTSYENLVSNLNKTNSALRQSNSLLKYSDLKTNNYSLIGSDQMLCSSQSTEQNNIINLLPAKTLNTINSINLPVNSQTPCSQSTITTETNILPSNTSYNPNFNIIINNNSIYNEKSSVRDTGTGTDVINNGTQTITKLNDNTNNQRHYSVNEMRNFPIVVPLKKRFY